MLAVEQAPGDGRRPHHDLTPTLAQAETRAILLSFAGRIDADDAGAHNNLGVLFYTRGLIEAAADEFTAALDRDPKMAIAQRNLEITAFTTGWYERRTSELAAKIADGRDRHSARHTLGRLHLLLGESSEAIEQFRALLEEDPNDVQALAGLAQSEQRRGWMEAAAAACARALVLHPGDARLHLLAAEVAYHRGLNDEAVRAVECALRADPDLADAHFLLAFVLGDMGDQERAREATRHAAQLNPSLGRARANLELERFVPGAVSALTARQRQGAPAVSPEPTGGAHSSLALAFRQKGYLREAMKEYRLALDSGERRRPVLEAMAEVYLLQKESAQAMTLYTTLLDESPGRAKYWNEQGVALHQEGRLDDARAAYERAIACDERYGVAWNNLGVASFHLGQLEHAVDALRQALASAPTLIRARLNLSLLLFRQKEYPLCLDAYRQTLRMAPEHPVAWNGVGLVFAEWRKFEDARNAFVRAIDARPDFAEARYNLSFALANLGDFAGALRETKRALELDPYYVSQKFELAVDFAWEDPRVGVPPDLGTNRRDETVADFRFDASAMQALVRALEPTVPHHHPADAYADARAAADRGETETAIAAVNRALAAGADRHDGLLLLGELFLAAGMHGEALERFQQAGALAEDTGAPLAGQARALLLLARGAEAVIPAEAWYRLAPQDVEACLMVARARLGAGDIEGALTVLEEARRLAPVRADIAQLTGDAWRAGGAVARAIDAYRHALSLDPALQVPRLQLAQLLAAGGDVTGAEAELLAVLARDAGHEEAALLLAGLRRSLGRAADTIDLLVDILRRNPAHLDAIASLGESLFLAGRRQDAAHAFARVLRFDPEHVAALYFDGVLLAETHRYEAAMDRWQRVQLLEPASEYARRARRDARTATDLERIFAPVRRRGAA